MIDNIDFRDLSFAIMFVVLYFVVPWIVVKLTYDKRSKFDLSAMWVYKDQVDKFAVFVSVAFWVHTSSMILWTLMRTIQTQDYLAYAGVWVTPILVKMVGAAFGNGKEPPAAASQAPPAAPPSPTQGIVG